MTARFRIVLLWTVGVLAAAGPVALGVVALSSRPAPVPLVTGGGVPAPAVPAAPAGAAPVVAPQETYAAWAGRMAAATGIPARAVAAYGHAEVLLAAERPDCALSWATIAGVASVESDHGRFSGRALGRDGRPDRPIIGLALDGSPGVAAIQDTDDGHYDGDPVWDRAVGPLQFVPGTWREFAADGDGDGATDPQDVDDAAVAAGRYLCAAGGDLSTTTDWHTAVLRYNASTAYAASVLSATNEYAELSRRA
ncbi:lytic transglycosylase domain-containing protein [Actinophytocola sediminis]